MLKKGQTLFHYSYPIHFTSTYPKKGKAGYGQGWPDCFRLGVRSRHHAFWSAPHFHQWHQQNGIPNHRPLGSGYGPTRGLPPSLSLTHKGEIAHIKPTWGIGYQTSLHYNHSHLPVDTDGMDFYPIHLLKSNPCHYKVDDHKDQTQTIDYPGHRHQPT